MGHQGRPEPVGDDPLPDQGSKAIDQDAGPGGSQEVPGSGIGGGDDGSQVRCESPPERRRCLLRRQWTHPNGRSQECVDGEAGGFGEVEPPDEDGPKLIRHNSSRVRTVFGEDGGPPVGAVVPATRDLEAAFDQVGVAVSHRDPSGTLAGRA